MADRTRRGLAVRRPRAAAHHARTGPAAVPARAPRRRAPMPASTGYIEPGAPRRAVDGPELVGMRGEGAGGSSPPASAWSPPPASPRSSSPPGAATPAASTPSTTRASAPRSRRRSTPCASPIATTLPPSTTAAIATTVATLETTTDPGAAAHRPDDPGPAARAARRGRDRARPRDRGHRGQHRHRQQRWPAAGLGDLQRQRPRHRHGRRHPRPRASRPRSPSASAATASSRATTRPRCRCWAPARPSPIAVRWRVDRAPVVHVTLDPPGLADAATCPATTKDLTGTVSASVIDESSVAVGRHDVERARARGQRADDRGRARDVVGPPRAARRPRLVDGRHHGHRRPGQQRFRGHDVRRHGLPDVDDDLTGLGAPVTRR